MELNGMGIFFSAIYEFPYVYRRGRIRKLTLVWKRKENEKDSEREEQRHGETGREREMEGRRK